MRYSMRKSRRLNAQHTSLPQGWTSPPPASKWSETALTQRPCFIVSCSSGLVWIGRPQAMQRRGSLHRNDGTQRHHRGITA